VSISLYSASVPTFRHYLERLRDSLELAAAHARQGGVAESALLGATLADGMFPLAQQISTACSFTLRAYCPLLGSETPPLAGDSESFAGLRTRIGGTLHWLERMDSNALACAEELPVTTRAGFASRQFSARDYVLNYALPNFFFHLCMAYAVLRSQGVALGKQDFDGYHQYPPGFSFGAAAGG
jgi:hypothetical protein